jgi:hypothetical protein
VGEIEGGKSKKRIRNGIPWKARQLMTKKKFWVAEKGEQQMALSQWEFR